VTAGAVVRGTMRNEIREGIFLADQAGEFRKRIFRAAYTPRRGLLGLWKSVGPRGPNSTLIGHW
jgi:hypothetical protein